MRFSFGAKAKARRLAIEAETARRRADERAGLDGLSEERRERAERVRKELRNTWMPSEPPEFGTADWRAHQKTMRGE